MAGGNKNFVAVVIMAVVLVAFAMELANASSLTVWQGPGCNQGAVVLRNCGCSAINLNGGYNFVYNGQPANLYNQGGCSGPVQTTLRSSTSMCSGFGWKSMFIQCKK